MKKIAFESVGALPVKEGIKEPEIYLLGFNPIFGANPHGEIKFTSKDGSPVSYSFNLIKNENTNEWYEWQAMGYEDCEFGYGSISAIYKPENKRYEWEVRFEHDGDPIREVWGGKFKLMEDE